MGEQSYFLELVNGYYDEPSEYVSSKYLDTIGDYLSYEKSIYECEDIIIDFLYKDISPKEHLQYKEYILVRALISMSNSKEAILDIALTEKCEVLINLIKFYFINDISLIDLIEKGRVDCLEFMYHEHVPWNKDIDRLFPLSPELKGYYPRMVLFFHENLENWINGIFPYNIKPCKK